MSSGSVTPRTLIPRATPAPQVGTKTPDAQQHSESESTFFPPREEASQTQPPPEKYVSTKDRTWGMAIPAAQEPKKTFALTSPSGKDRTPKLTMTEIFKQLQGNLDSIQDSREKIRFVESIVVKRINGHTYDFYLKNSEDSKNPTCFLGKAKHDDPTCFPEKLQEVTNGANKGVLFTWAPAWYQNNHARPLILQQAWDRYQPKKMAEEGSLTKKIPHLNTELGIKKISFFKGFMQKKLLGIYNSGALQDYNRSILFKDKKLDEGLFPTLFSNERDFRFETIYSKGYYIRQNFDPNRLGDRHIVAAYEKLDDWGKIQFNQLYSCYYKTNSTLSISAAIGDLPENIGTQELINLGSDKDLALIFFASLPSKLMVEHSKAKIEEVVAFLKTELDTADEQQKGGLSERIAKLQEVSANLRKEDLIPPNDSLTMQAFLKIETLPE